MAPGWSKLSSEEIRLAKMWFHDDDMAPSEIAELLHRDKSTLTRLLCQELERKKDGRPRALKDEQIDFMVKKLEAMILKANNEYRVTCEDVKKACRLKVSIRTMLEAFHERDIYFRPCRDKPDLTPQDIIERRAFADKFAGKPEAFWLENIDLTIDVKYFKIYTNRSARSRAAREGTWGSFRTKAQGLLAQYVRPSKRLKWNPGARGVHVLAGVGKGQVLLWEYIDGRRWSGSVAAEMYKGPVKDCLQNAYPGRSKWTILEDNDPTGFRSKAGLQAKDEAGLKVFQIPKRSPQLNMCDYALWKEVEKRMRAQEKRFLPSFREARVAFLKRLRRTAMRLPSSFINRSLKNMKIRCQRLAAAKGGHFEEGGHH